MFGGLTLGIRLFDGFAFIELGHMVFEHRTFFTYRCMGSSAVGTLVFGWVVYLAGFVVMVFTASEAFECLGSAGSLLVVEATVLEALVCRVCGVPLFDGVLEVSDLNLFPPG